MIQETCISINSYENRTTLALPNANGFMHNSSHETVFTFVKNVELANYLKKFYKT